MHEAHCPHCMMVIAQDADARFPPRPMRCPYCRLAIAPGRGQLDDQAGDRTAGSASGVLAHAARREEGDPVTDDAIADALRFAARQADTPVQRLRMIDYERVSVRHASLPRLASILDHCGTWKGARRMVDDESRATPKAGGAERR